MQSLGVYAMFECSWCVWELMHCSGVFANCNVLVLMKCLDIEAMFGYLSNIQVFMQRSVVDAMFIMC